MIRELVCPICGTRFKTNSANKKYCSNSCRNRSFYLNHHEKRIQESKEYRRKHKLQLPIQTKVCSICGKEFKTNSKNKKYCSKKCSKTAHSRMKGKKLKECIQKHNNCFSCPTEDGECLFR